MDIFASDAHLVIMLARVLTLLAVFAIVLVTTAAAGHATRMADGHGDPSMTSAMPIHGMAGGHDCCDTDQPQGAAQDGLCDVACAGLPAILATLAPEAAPAFAPARHALPAEGSPVSRSPGLNERPPKTRLL